MRQLLFLFGLLGSTIALNCTTKNFNYCSANLATGLGLPGLQGQPMFQNYTIMYNQLLYLFGVNPGSTAGPLQACNSLEAFNGCSYGAGPDCLKTQTLLANTDLQDAYAIIGTLRMYQFNCGPGLNTLQHEGLECAQRILFNYQNTLQACAAAYVSSVSNNPKGGCDYTNTLINCWSAPFYTAPCRRAEAADVWWSCEANKQFASAQYPNCNIDCDAKLMALNQKNHIATHFKVVDDEFWFKIPNYLTKIDGEVTEVEGPWMNN